MALDPELQEFLDETRATERHFNQLSLKRFTAIEAHLRRIDTLVERGNGKKSLKQRMDEQEKEQERTNRVIERLENILPWIETRKKREEQERGWMRQSVIQAVVQFLILALLVALGFKSFTGG